jgi:hypothetical protein
MAMRLRKSLPQTAAETFTFLKQTDIAGLVRLLAEHRGHHNDKDRFYRLLYSCLIYDHYADAYRQINASNGIAAGWYQLARHADVERLYETMHPRTDESVIGDITLSLPIASASPLFRNSAPRTPAGFAAGDYQIRDLSCLQFIEVCWVVRCNFLHGSYDPTESDTSILIRNIARPFASLVWDMIRETPLH